MKRKSESRQSRGNRSRREKRGRAGKGGGKGCPQRIRALQVAFKNGYYLNHLPVRSLRHSVTQTVNDKAWTMVSRRLFTFLFFHPFSPPQAGSFINFFLTFINFLTELTQCENRNNHLLEKIKERSGCIQKTRKNPGNFQSTFDRQIFACSYLLIWKLNFEFPSGWKLVPPTQLLCLEQKPLQGRFQSSRQWLWKPVIVLRNLAVIHPQPGARDVLGFPEGKRVKLAGASILIF